MLSLVGVKVLVNAEFRAIAGRRRQHVIDEHSARPVPDHARRPPAISLRDTGRVGARLPRRSSGYSGLPKGRAGLPLRIDVDPLGMLRHIDRTPERIVAGPRGGGRVVHLVQGDVGHPANAVFGRFFHPCLVHRHVTHQGDPGFAARRRTFRRCRTDTLRRGSSSPWPLRRCRRAGASAGPTRADVLHSSWAPWHVGGGDATDYNDWRCAANQGPAAAISLPAPSDTIFLACPQPAAHRRRMPHMFQRRIRRADRFRQPRLPVWLGGPGRRSDVLRLGRRAGRRASRAVCPGRRRCRRPCWPRDRSSSALVRPRCSTPARRSASDRGTVWTPAKTGSSMRPRRAGGHRGRFPLDEMGRGRGHRSQVAHRAGWLSVHDNPGRKAAGAERRAEPARAVRRIRLPAAGDGRRRRAHRAPRLAAWLARSTCTIAWMGISGCRWRMPGMARGGAGRRALGYGENSLVVALAKAGSDRGSTRCACRPT